VPSTQAPALVGAPMDLDPPSPGGPPPVSWPADRQ
jgi:hypothetical protein